MSERGPAPTPDPHFEEGHRTARPGEGLDAITRHRLRTLGLEPDALCRMPLRERMDTLYARFVDRVPYENLSSNRSCQESPDDPSAWPRGTDRFLRDNRARGFGGTSFTLAYALRALFSGLGANAHCTIGRNLVTEEAHAAVVVYAIAGPLLYDPALLTRGPLPIRPGGRLDDALGTLSLAPQRGATLTVLIQAKGASKPRPLYSLVPAPTPPPRFRQTWVASFCRGRCQPLRLARRVGDEVRRYSERPRRLEILSADGRAAHVLGHAPVRELHLLFGIDEACLEAWFDRER